jgi:hypothetical protein
MPNKPPRKQTHKSHQSKESRTNSIVENAKILENKQTFNFFDFTDGIVEIYAHWGA